MSYRENARALVVLFSAVVMLTGCSLPWHHQQPEANAGSGGAGSNDTQAAQCESLRTEIRSNLENEREAPAKSINEDIVAADEGNADQRIQALQTQYDQLGCSAADLPARHERVAPLPPAPGTQLP